MNFTNIPPVESGVRYWKAVECALPLVMELVAINEEGRLIVRAFGMGFPGDEGGDVATMGGLWSECSLVPDNKKLCERCGGPINAKWNTYGPPVGGYKNEEKEDY